MRHDEQVALIRRALSLIDTGSTERGAPATSPLERYLDWPHADGSPHVPAADCAPAQVPAAQALGFVWVVPRMLAAGESTELDIRAWLGRFGEDLRQHQRLSLPKRSIESLGAQPQQKASDRSTVLGTTLIPEKPTTEKATSHWRKNADSFWGALDEAEIGLA